MKAKHTTVIAFKYSNGKQILITMPACVLFFVFINSIKGANKKETEAPFKNSLLSVTTANNKAEIFR